MLATTRFPLVNYYHCANKPVDMPVAWTKFWGNGRVFYNSLGHHDDVFDNSPNAAILMERGMMWAVGGKEFAEDGYFWAQLGPERMEWLRTLPQERDVWLSGVHFRLFHGRPVTPLISVQADKAVFVSSMGERARLFLSDLMAERKEILEICAKTGCVVKTMPSIYQI